MGVGRNQRTNHKHWMSERRYPSGLCATKFSADACLFATDISRYCSQTRKNHIQFGQNLAFLQFLWGKRTKQNFEREKIELVYQRVSLKLFFVLFLFPLRFWPFSRFCARSKRFRLVSRKLNIFSGANSKGQVFFQVS